MAPSAGPASAAGTNSRASVALRGSPGRAPRAMGGPVSDIRSYQPKLPGRRCSHHAESAESRSAPASALRANASATGASAWSPTDRFADSRRQHRTTGSVYDERDRCDDDRSAGDLGGGEALAEYGVGLGDTRTGSSEKSMAALTAVAASMPVAVSAAQRTAQAPTITRGGGCASCCSS
jgi:hypothetical protein